MLFGTDIEFNDKKASDFGLIMLSIDNNGFDKINVGRKRKIETYSIGNTAKKRIISNKYEDVLEEECELFKTDENPFTEEEYRNIEKWITKSKGYVRIMIYKDEELCTHYLNGVISDIQPIGYGNKVYGIYFAITNDAPYWWEDFSKEYDLTEEPSYILNTVLSNTSDDIHSPIYPNINFVASDTTELKIENITNGVIFDITELQDEEEMSFDNETLVFTSNIDNRNYYNTYNKKIFKLDSGDNTLKITGNGVLTISGRFARKVGY